MNLVEYKKIVSKISIPADHKIKQKTYLQSGALPVIDQGQELVGGYTDDCQKQIVCDLPVIVFGDHTKNVKYINFPFCAGADGIKILKAKDDVVPKYLYYGTIFLTYCIEDKGYARHYQHIEKYDLLVPPLPEQERIVAKIEELFSQLDAAVAELKSVKEKLAIYRQAVMQNVIVQYTQDIPNVFIKDVCNEIKVGIVIKPSQYYTTPESGIKAFRSANVREFYIDDKDWVFLSKDGHLKNKRSEVHIGDILIVRSGYPGTACVVTEKFDGSNAIDVLIAVPNREKITPEYLCAYTNSPLGKKLVADKKRGVAQAHLNVGGYSKISIPIPEILVQNIIVEEIHQKVSICNNIEQTVDTALQQAAALRQSILKQAFEGKL